MTAPLESLDQNKSFTEQGGTSLQAAKIAALYAELGVPLSSVVLALLNAPSVKHAKASLRVEVQRQASCTDPRIDCETLPATLVRSDTLATLVPLEPASTMPAAPLAPIVSGPTKAAPTLFLTGATGFVGRFVLTELLGRGLVVACLVRAGNTHAALLRLQQALIDARKWVPAWRLQLVVVLDSLGTVWPIDVDDNWLALAASVSTVIHCGAVVDLKKDYAFHRPPNVIGTREAIRFAIAAHARLLYISTTDVVPHGHEVTGAKLPLQF